MAKGADVNATDNKQETVLMDAAMGGNTDVVKILLSKGVDVNAKNNKGETALSIARGKSFSDVVKLLKAAGARE